MRKFKFNKLVRDKIVSGMKKDGGIPHFKVLSDVEYIQALEQKLIEEATEFVIQPDEDPLDSIVDVQEVIDNLVKALNKTKADIRKMQTIKNKKRGSFKKRLFVDYAEVKDDSLALSYLVKNKEKYLEIKD